MCGEIEPLSNCSFEEYDTGFDVEMKFQQPNEMPTGEQTFTITSTRNLDSDVVLANSGLTHKTQTIIDEFTVFWCNGDEYTRQFVETNADLFYGLTLTVEALSEEPNVVQFDERTGG